MSTRSETSENPIEDLKRRNADLEVLYETVKDLSSTLSVERVLQRLLDRTLLHLEAEIGSILLLGDDDHLRVMVSKGLPADVVERTEMKIGEGISGHVALHGQPLIVEDVEAHPTFRRRNRERYYTSTLISAPLVRNGVLLGVININNKTNRDPFQPHDLRLLEAIAAHAAVALGNARKYEDTLRLSQIDGLTGLANHGHFYKTLEREFERARRYERGLALAMIDIDHFKQYNDRNGHRAGDQALVAVARIIGDRSRAHDVVARYGGEEGRARLWRQIANRRRGGFARRRRSPHHQCRGGLVRDEHHRDQPAGGCRRYGALSRQVPGPQPHLLARLFLRPPPQSARGLGRP